MSRATEYKFVETDTDTLVAEMISEYEELTGNAVQPASPARLLIQWAANWFTQLRVDINRAANQNIPSRAEGENLDALAELFYNVERPEAQPATATVRFTITEAQGTAILIPAGTRVTDSSATLYWHTLADAYIPIGQTYIDLHVECMTPGVMGNGYSIGQLNTIVDVYDYYDSCSNTTESANGSDRATDEEFYGLMRASMDGYSTAGSRGSYEYHAKRVNPDIVDVAAISPSAGEVEVYALMEDGTTAPSEVKAAVLAACNSETVRPLTDHVSVKDAETVSYNISFTYYISTDSTKPASEIASDVADAVEAYKIWQRSRLGRDINPDKLREYLYTAGIKRLVMTAPTYTVLSDGSDGDTPQIASVGTVNIVSGGYEDD